MKNSSDGGKACDVTIPKASDLTQSCNKNVLLTNNNFIIKTYNTQNSSQIIK